MAHLRIVRAAVTLFQTNLLIPNLPGGLKLPGIANPLLAQSCQVLPDALAQSCLV